MNRTRISLLIWCAALGTWGCATPEESEPSIAVGTSLVELPSRDGATMRVQLWYPMTESPSGITHRYDGVFEGGAYASQAADCSQPRPVVVFSHGNSGVRYQSFFLTEHLARRGYIVAAPDHQQNTLFDQDDDAGYDVIRRRPVEVASTYDGLVADPAVNFISGCIDPDAGYAIVGHSLGGYTALAVAGASVDRAGLVEACALDGANPLCRVLGNWPATAPSFVLADPRIWAVVAMAPAGHEILQNGISNISVPTAIFAAEVDILTPTPMQAQPIYQALQAKPRIFAEISDVGHFAFSHFCEVLSSLDFCDSEQEDPQLSFGLIQNLTFDFLQYVRGENDQRRGVPPASDRVTWAAEF